MILTNTFRQADITICRSNSSLASKKKRKSQFTRSHSSTLGLLLAKRDRFNQEVIIIANSQDHRFPQSTTTTTTRMIGKDIDKRYIVRGGSVPLLLLPPGQDSATKNKDIQRKHMVEREE